MCPSGALFRDMFQGSMRVRYTKTPNVYISVPKSKKSDKPATFSAIHDMLLHKRELLEEFEKDVMRSADLHSNFKPEKDWFVDLLCWNMLERNLQLVDPMGQIMALLQQLKWTWSVSKDMHEHEDIVMQDGTLLHYISPEYKQAILEERESNRVTLRGVYEETKTQVASQDTYSALKVRDGKGLTSQKEIYSLKIQVVKKFFKPEFQLELSYDQFENWQRQLSKMFRVIKASKAVEDPERVIPLYLKDLQLSEYETEQYALLSHTDMPHIDLQTHLCQAMGLKHCLDFETVIFREAIKNAKVDICEYLKKISDLSESKFEINPQKMDKMTDKEFLGKINNALSFFGQMQLKTVSAGRSRRGRSDIRNPSYQLSWRLLQGKTLKDLIDNRE
jgi:hypothetical protein